MSCRRHDVNLDVTSSGKDRRYFWRWDLRIGTAQLDSFLSTEVQPQQTPAESSGVGASHINTLRVAVHGSSANNPGGWLTAPISHT